MMRRFTVTLLAATAMGVIACQGASAADLGHPVYKAPPPPPPPVQDWSGIYVGLEGGYGWGKQDFNTAFDPFFGSKFGGNSVFPCKIFGPCTPDPTLGSRDQSGWLFGGFVGAQKQWGNWVLGVEADFDGTDIKGSTTATRSQVFTLGTCGEGCTRTLTVSQSANINSKIDELGTVRAKVGFAPQWNAWGGQWMIYGTGGLAWANLKNDFSASQSNVFCDDGSCSGNVGGFSASASGGLSMFGWTAGAGIDWKWQIDQGSAWVFGVEYLHYEFPSNTLTLADNQFGTGSTFGIDTKERVDVVKARISYLFSIH